MNNDATLHETVAEAELDPTSATVVLNIARKVASCIGALLKNVSLHVQNVRVVRHLKSHFYWQEEILSCMFHTSHNSNFSCLITSCFE